MEQILLEAISWNKRQEGDLEQWEWFTKGKSRLPNFIAF